ncbi:flagellar basal body rod protein FlgB [Helicobacter monodelphidis]|uniref:flagellar basal body rod protein FlgB n=1 Tax=Helicobacter sp. 15-1451 TaxID=2004995 RepID=UPI000DCD3FC1|nr:flagellar basal body rod protein FlgB [Helicobacter sp. 15-1451]RAX56966.1 flagellar basal body rod protein FlgB [Helicobacter sp. 15-1451]
MISKAESIFSYSKAREVAYKALDYRSLRQDLIASNIANVDTPMYRPKDVNFEQVLAKKAHELLNYAPNKKLMLGKADGRHLDPTGPRDDKSTIFYRDGHLARNDGNSVDLDVETSEMGKNSVMYQAIVGSLKKHGGIYSYAIESSRSL